MIGMVFKYKTFPRWLSISLIGGGLVIFISYPIAGDQVQLITGFNRLLFSLFCICICVGCYKLRISTPTFIDRQLAMLGEASYSIYLLHPIIWWIFYKSLHFIGNTFGFVVSPLLIIITALLTSIFVSFLVYENFETYFMKKANGTKKSKPTLQL